MRPRRPRSGALLALLVLFALWAAPYALPAFAGGEDGPPEAAPSDAAPKQAMGVDEFEKWLGEKPAVLVVVGVLKFGGAAVGLLLLVLLWRRFDRARIGAGPPLEKVQPTQLVGPLQALGIVLVLFAGLELAMGALLQINPGWRTDLIFRMAVMSAGLLPLAVFVILRRQRMAGPFAWRPGRAFKRALWAFCVASALVIPASFLSVFIVQALGRPITVYVPVAESVRSSQHATLALLGVFSVVVAPLTEECLFRGLLYPVVRSLGGGGRRGAVTAVVVVSLLFAAVHMHDVSFLPLFCLAAVLAIVFEFTNSLLAVIFTHALWNLTSLLPLFLRVLLP